MFLSAPACQLASFFIGIAEIWYMSGPVGNCENCCPRDDTIDIQYQLFTRSDPKQFELIPVGDENAFRATSFNPAIPTIIYVMGFSEATTGPSTTTIKNAYFKIGDYNFIAVDWSRLIVFPWYISAVRNTRLMGDQLAKFVQFLNGVDVKASSLHIIGFSLGAEAAGFAGKTLKRQGLMIGRITGLDPAYPGYSLTDSSGHLAKGDAIFVDVIHTNPGIFGFPNPIGDVDFYPNPGMWVQPGCWIDELLENREFRFIYGCSHIRAWRYYSESVMNPFGFPATVCRDWKSATSSCQFQVHGYMGFAARKPMSGKMYLETNKKSPFAKNGP